MTLHTSSDFSGVAEKKVPGKGDEGGGIKKQGGIKNVKRNFNETTFGGRRSLRSPDKKMEP